MIYSRFFAGSLALLACMGFAVRPAAAQVLSDNFNSENGGGGQLNYTGFANFNADNVDLIGNGAYSYYDYSLPYTFALSLELTHL